VSLRQTISHGFPVAAQIAVAPELPPAAPIDALPATVAEPTADAPVRIAEVALIDAPAPFTAARMTAAADCAAAPALSLLAHDHYLNDLPARAGPGDRHGSD
jgi:hypothetical protein